MSDGKHNISKYVGMQEKIKMVVNDYDERSFRLVFMSKERLCR